MPDRNKPNCFELYATGGNDFIKGSYIYISIIILPPTTGPVLHAKIASRGERIYNSKTFIFVLFYLKACKTDSEGKVVEGKHTVYRMSAAEQAEKDEWIACIRYTKLFPSFFCFSLFSCFTNPHIRSLILSSDLHLRLLLD